MVVEYDTTDRFYHARRLVGPYATEETDYTTRVDLAGLPQGQTIFVRVSYVDPHSHRIQSEAQFGQFRTAPLKHGD